MTSPGSEEASASPVPLSGEADWVLSTQPQPPAAAPLGARQSPIPQRRQTEMGTDWPKVTQPWQNSQPALSGHRSRLRPHACPLSRKSGSSRRFRAQGQARGGRALLPRAPRPASAVPGVRASPEDAGLGARACSGGGGGSTGRRQGDPRLRSPQTARLLPVPPLPNFPPRSSPAADLQVQRALGALRGCRGAGPHSHGYLPGSALFGGGLGHVASRATLTPGPGPCQPLPAASPARRLAEPIRSSPRAGHREGQPLAQGHTARRREAGASRRWSPPARVPGHGVVLTAGLALELPHFLGRRVGSAHGAPRGPGRPTQAGDCLSCAALEPGGDVGTAAGSRFRVGLERPLIAAGGGAARS